MERPWEVICVFPSSQYLPVCVSQPKVFSPNNETVIIPHEWKSEYSTYTDHWIDKYCDQHVPNILGNTKKPLPQALAKRTNHRTGEMTPNPHIAHHQYNFNMSNPDIIDTPNLSFNGTSSYRVEPAQNWNSNPNPSHLSFCRPASRTCCLTGAWSFPVAPYRWKFLRPLPACRRSSSPVRNHSLENYQKKLWKYTSCF